MKFKKLRYNIIVVGLVAIISCCVALPLFTGSPDSSGLGDGEAEVPGIEEPIDDPNVEEDPDGFGDEDGDDEEEDEDFEYYKALDLINYSVNLLYTGKGFSSTFTQLSTNNAVTWGVKVPQNIKGKLVRSGNSFIEESYLWSNYTGVGSDQTKNYYQVIYGDKNNDKVIEGTTNKYDYNKMTYDSNSLSTSEMTYSQAYSKYLIMIGDSYPIKTTKKDSIYSDKVDGNYREIRVQYDVGSLSSSFKNVFGSTGQLSSINYGSLEVVYKINIKTGKMYSITRIEKLSGKYDGSMNVVTTSTTVHKFTSVDKEQIVESPIK